MKKYGLTIFIGLVIGFLLCSFFLKQYNDYSGIKVSNIGNEIYFLEYGVYSTLDILEENTIDLQNYVYSENDNKYYVYVGITALEENANKILNHYKKLGNDVTIKKYSITNKNFLEQLKTYDEVLKNTKDDTAISSVISQVLNKYEEVVISGG